MNAIPDRILTFERCFNFRDVGGYAGHDGRTVRWRRLFRSMTPQHMSQADAVAVRELDIRLVIDFRGDRYPTSGPVPGEGGTRLATSPVQRSEAEYERYRVAPPHEALPELLETYGPQFAGALETMAQHPEANILFHCRLGKDRTGVFAALLLKLLGAGDDDVVRDYMLTELQEPHARRLLAEVEVDDDDVSRREPRVAKEPPSRAAIEGVLRRLVSRYGDAHGYFVHHGVTTSLLAAFVETALEPSTGRQAAAPGDTVIA